jgi:hypothetical protein
MCGARWRKDAQACARARERAGAHVLGRDGSRARGGGREAARACARRERAGAPESVVISANSKIVSIEGKTFLFQMYPPLPFVMGLKSVFVLHHR